MLRLRCYSSTSSFESRHSPGMTDYDETLLASAPSVSRKQKQESYNIALLHPAPTPPSPIESAPLTSYRPSSPHATHPSKETYYPDRTSSARQPWYRSKKVLIAGGVGLVVVGAVVGGAVGGTVGHRSKNQSALASEGEGSSTGGVDVLPSASVSVPQPFPTATPTATVSNAPGSETFEPTGTDTRGVSPSSAGGGGQPIDISTSSPGDSDTAFPTGTETDSGGGGVMPSDSGVVSGVPVGDPTTTSTHRSHTRNTMFRGTVVGTPTAAPEGGDPIQEDPVQTDI